MLADSAASKLRAKVRNMSPQERESEDGLREMARLEAHDKAKAEAAAANGVKLRTTGLKRAINARLEDIAQDTASIKTAVTATQQAAASIKANTDATKSDTALLLESQAAMREQLEYLQAREKAREERRATRNKRLEQELFGDAERADQETRADESKAEDDPEPTQEPFEDASVEPPPHAKRRRTERPKRQPGLTRKSRADLQELCALQGLEARGSNKEMRESLKAAKASSNASADATATQGMKTSQRRLRSEGKRGIR